MSSNPKPKGGLVAYLTVDGAVKAWGDRYGALKDPFGVAWALNGPVRK